jgi:NADPH:quinone reductase-like Zn-dependent oxidoreductase
MRAIEAKSFSGYGGLRETELPKPQPARDKVLVRVAAAGVTPLDHAILSGGHPRAKAPLVLGNLFGQSPSVIAAAWRSILPLIVSGSVKPIVERVYPFGEAGEALRHLIEDRPFGKVVLAG